MRNTYPFLLLLLLPFLICCGADDRLFRPGINHPEIIGHELVKGTRILMVPPKDFTPATAMAGFQKGNKAQISIMDMQGMPFDTNATMLSKYKVETNGRKLLERGDLVINSYKGKYVKVQADRINNVIAVLFGDSSFTTLVNCIYNSRDKATEEAIVRSINSIRLDKAQWQEPFAFQKFYLEENNSGFKYLKSSGGLHYYSPEGQHPNDQTVTSLVAVIQLPNDGKETNPKPYADKMINQLADEYKGPLNIRSGMSSVINGIPAYQIEADKANNEKNILFYSCSLTGDGFSVMVGGIAKGDTSAMMDKFRMFAGAIRFRQ